MEITEKEYNQLKEKAENWDRLDAELAECYEKYSKSDLVDIGEKAAMAFGYL